MSPIGIELSMPLFGEVPVYGPGRCSGLELGLCEDDVGLSSIVACAFVGIGMLVP